MNNQQNFICALLLCLGSVVGAILTIKLSYFIPLLLLTTYAITPFYKEGSD